MLKFLKAKEDTIRKKRNALKEGIELKDYLRKLDFSVETDPFPHVVIDNFYKDDFYQKLLENYQSVFARGFSDKENVTKFQPFLDLTDEYAYDGYVYTPWANDAKIFDLFFSLSWNLFFSELFKQTTGWSTTLAYHHHPPHNKTGFVHHDDAKRTFPSTNRLQNGIVFREYYRTKAPHLQIPDVKLFTVKRKIALITYLGTENWKKGDGGETGLYKIAKESPVKLVEPLNNRLLAFEISHKSFHAFQKNEKTRDSIVQWFHTPESQHNPV